MSDISPYKLTWFYLLYRARATLVDDENVGHEEIEDEAMDIKEGSFEG